MTEYGRIHTDGSRSGGQPVIKTQHCPNCEATEQKLHDFKQTVSDAILRYLAPTYVPHGLKGFIIPAPKPDPLVAACNALNWDFSVAEELRTILDALGFEIREKNDDQ